jgi:carboxyl-terminal processing protease
MSTAHCSEWSRKAGSAVVLAVLASSFALADSPPSPPRVDLDNANTVEKGAALSPEVVKDFARTTWQAVEVLEDRHIKKASRQQLTEWAIRGLYARLDEKLPPSVAYRLETIQTLNKAELTKLLTDARTHLGKRRYLDDLGDIDFALAGIFSKLEPGYQHPPQRALAFKFCLGGSRPVPIGLETVSDAASGVLRVVTPLRGTPAHLAGIRAGDRITRMYELDRDPRKGEQTNFSGDELAARPTLLDGEPGSRIRLLVRREGVKQPLVFNLRRERIVPETVFGVSRRSDGSWDHLLDHEQKIAYIRLTELTRDTPDDLALALGDLQKQRFKGLVLDLRFSVGGLLSAAEAVTEQLAGKGPFCIVRTRQVKEVCDLVGAPKLPPRVSVVCLVNAETHKASQLIAACLQDRGRALIVGERTPGDGEIRNCTPIHGAELVFTVGVFDRASGRNLSRILTDGKPDEEWGVVPNKGYAVKLTREEHEIIARRLSDQRIIPTPPSSVLTATDDFSDRQLNAALDCLRKYPRKLD